MIVWKSWLGLGIAIVIALVVALVVIVIVALITRGAARRRAGAQLVLAKARHPFRILVVVVALWTAVAFSLPEPTWFKDPTGMFRKDVNHGFLIVTIILSTWLIAALIAYGLNVAVGRYDLGVADNRVARRAQTQLLIVRRLLIAVI